MLYYRNNLMAVGPTAQHPNDFLRTPMCHALWQAFYVHSHLILQRLCEVISQMRKWWIRDIKYLAEVTELENSGASILAVVSLIPQP